MREIVEDKFSLTIMYVKISLKSWFQYKVDALIRSFAVFLRESTNVIVIYLTLQSFEMINGWNTAELFFLFSIMFLTYGILIIFFTGLRDFSNIIRMGNFDRFILRPRSILFQIIISNSDWFAALGHGSLGIVLFIISTNKINITWDFYNIIYLILAIIGGVLIQGAIFFFVACCSFYIVKTNGILEMAYWNVRKFASYPISIFPKIVQYILIYIVPFAFVNYFPAQYFLRKDDLYQYPVIYIYLTPFVGVVMWVWGYVFWKKGLKHYSSVGN